MSSCLRRGILGFLLLFGSTYLSAEDVRFEELEQRLAKYRGGSFVFTSWGGAYQTAQRKAFLEPFSAKFGIEIVEDSPMDSAKLIAMVEDEKVVWDVTDNSAASAMRLGRAGYLAPLDFSIINKDEIIPESVSQWTVGISTYSTILAYRNDAFSEGKRPSSVSDLWNFESFPGKRSLEDSPVDNIVFALMADGVPANEIYPISDELLERAFKKLEQLKPHVDVWWKQGAQPAQLLANEEVVMSTAWNGRIYDIQQSGAPLSIVWNGGQISSEIWSVTKGAPNTDLAMLFIAWCTSKERNASLSQYIPYSPANVESFDQVPEETRPHLPSTHIDQQIPMDAKWWSENGVRVNDMWRRWKFDS